MNNTLYIYHHLGLGDHFDCNGMIRYLLKHSYDECDKVAIFSKSCHYDTIKYMYRDNNLINVYKVSQYEDKERRSVKRVLDRNKAEKVLVIGHENYLGAQQEICQNKNCWEFFYDQLNLPYNIRYDYFFVARNRAKEQKLYDKLNPKNEPYIFLHDDPARGFVIDRSHLLNSKLKIIENDTSKNIFDFISIIESATEIHCMESSFKTLIDMFAKQDNIFYHDFRRHPLGKNSLKQWKVIKYDY